MSRVLQRRRHDWVIACTQFYKCYDNALLYIFSFIRSALPHLTPPAALAAEDLRVCLLTRSLKAAVFV